MFFFTHSLLFFFQFEVLGMMSAVHCKMVYWSRDLLRCLFFAWYWPRTWQTTCSNHSTNTWHICTDLPTVKCMPLLTKEDVRYEGVPQTKFSFRNTRPASGLRFEQPWSFFNFLTFHMHSCTDDHTLNIYHLLTWNINKTVLLFSSFPAPSATISSTFSSLGPRLLSAKLTVEFWKAQYCF